MTKRKKKGNVFFKYLSMILVIVTLVSSFALYFLDVIPSKFLIPFYVVLGLIIIFFIVKMLGKSKRITKLFISLLVFILLIVEVSGLYYAFTTTSFLYDILDKGYRIDIYGLYVSGNYSSIEELNSKNIAIYKSDDESLDSAVKKLDKKIKYKEKYFDSKYESVESVLNSDASAVYMNKSYMDIYMEDHDVNLKLLREIEVISKSSNSFKSVNVTNSPFTVYLSGVDTTGSITKQSRSDVNLLLVVNPRSGKILVVGTPRDYYLSLLSKGSKDKLTHIGLYGVEESAKSLSDLYGVDVNYYARVNFTSFIKVIDKLGKIDIDVEKPDYRYNKDIDCGIGYVCEQNSNRKFGKDMIYIKYGNRELNGEQALAYARNRYQYSGGDNARVRHQSEVIEALLNKVMSPKILTKYSSLIKELSGGILTNIDQKTITKLVNYQLDENIKWEFEMISAKGNDSSNTTYSTGSQKVYVMEPDSNSINEIKAKINEIMN